MGQKQLGNQSKLRESINKEETSNKNKKL